MSQGIYLITSPNKSLYIGLSTNIEQRWEDYHKYKCALQRRLYNNFKKYGVENHKFEVIVSLEDYATIDELNFWERQMELYYRACGCELLNIRECGGATGKMADSSKELIRQSRLGPKHFNWGRVYSQEERLKFGQPGERNPMYGKKHTEETKQKQSECKRGKYVGDKNPFARAILQYKLTGEFIKEWNCINVAARELNINRNTIGKCCRGEFKQGRGFVWKYKE